MRASLPLFRALFASSFVIPVALFATLEACVGDAGTAGQVEPQSWPDATVDAAPDAPDAGRAADAAADAPLPIPGAARDGAAAPLADAAAD